MRHPLSSIVALLLTSVALVACGSGNGSTDSTGQTATPATTTSAPDATPSAGKGTGGKGGKGSKKNEPKVTKTGRPSASGIPSKPEVKGGTLVKLVATEPAPEKFGFSPPSLVVTAGAVTLAMVNPDFNKTAHSIAIEGKSGKVVQPGGTSTVSVKLKPGTYSFFCPVANHRAEGMVGRLEVSGG